MEYKVCTEYVHFPFLRILQTGFVIETFSYLYDYVNAGKQNLLFQMQERVMNPAYRCTIYSMAIPY